MRNKHGGGANTNINGLAFELETDLNTILSKNGIETTDDGKLIKNGQCLGYNVPKHSFYKKFLEPNGVNYEEYNSVQWLPDEALVIDKNKTVFIVEKKFQNSAGSVDEKLPGCDFKKREYEKLVSGLGYSVSFIYLWNDWFEQERYKDVKDYIISSGCSYYLNKIPISVFGLDN